jgi:hypothetical protein
MRRLLLTLVLTAVGAPAAAAQVVDSAADAAAVDRIARDAASAAPAVTRRPDVHVTVTGFPSNARLVVVSPADYEKERRARVDAGIPLPPARRSPCEPPAHVRPYPLPSKPPFPLPMPLPRAPHDFILLADDSARVVPLAVSPKRNAVDFSQHGEIPCSAG